MSSLKATYTSKTSSNVIEVPLDTSKPLTDSIVNLQREVNTFLTNILQEEKKAKQTPAPVKTVEQDEAEQELKEMAQEEEEAEQTNEANQEEDNVEMNKANQEEDNDSPMAIDRPEVDDKQTIKKQKTDL